MVSVKGLVRKIWNFGNGQLWRLVEHLVAEEQ